MPDLFKEKALEWDTNEMIKALSTGIGKSILQRVALHDDMTVMDFGAGTGLITSYITPHVKTVTAVDVSKSMLEKLAAKPELQGKIEILCQDIIEHPPGNNFDLIVSAMALHHVQDIDALLQRFAGILKPGALVALADLDKEDGSFHPDDTEGVYHHGFERTTLESQMLKHGFTDIEFVTAHVVSKEDREYPVFLVTASKP